MRQSTYLWWYLLLHLSLLTASAWTRALWLNLHPCLSMAPCYYHDSWTIDIISFIKELNKWPYKWLQMLPLGKYLKTSICNLPLDSSLTASPIQVLKHREMSRLAPANQVLKKNSHEHSFYQDCRYCANLSNQILCIPHWWIHAKDGPYTFYWRRQFHHLVTLWKLRQKWHFK